MTPVPSVRGEVGVVTRHQWFHAVGYSLDDLRVHWAFPLHPGVRKKKREREGGSQSTISTHRLRTPPLLSGEILTRRPGRQWEASMLTGHLATLFLQSQVPLSSSRVSDYLATSCLVGQYVFQVSLSETTAKTSVEFWLSPTFHPWQTLLLAFSSLSDKVSTSPPSFLLQPLSTENSEQQFQKSRSFVSFLLHWMKPLP